MARKVSDKARLEAAARTLVLGMVERLTAAAKTPEERGTAAGLAHGADVSALIKRMATPHKTWNWARDTRPSYAAIIREEMTQIECDDPACPGDGATYLRPQDKPKTHTHWRPYPDGARVRCPQCNEVIRLSVWWQHGCPKAIVQIPSVAEMPVTTPKRRPLAEKWIRAFDIARELNQASEIDAARHADEKFYPKARKARKAA